MRTRATALACLAALALVAAPALAADPPKLGWSDTAELSYVLTAGNSESTTLGFGNKLARRWEKSLFTFKIGGIRAESTTVTRTAVGPDETNFQVYESSKSALSAENYIVSLQYDRKISERLVWNAGTAWDRNRFAGIENRYAAWAGLGNVWIDKERMKFKTDYSATYTRREDVVFDPARKETFGGLRFASDYLQKFGETTTFTNTFTLDDNLQETSDWRGDMTNAVAVAMSKNLALKAALRWLYANQPAKQAVPLSETVGGPEIGTVLVPLEKLDTIFTTSLVVNW